MNNSLYEEKRAAMASKLFYDYLTDTQREEIIQIVKPYTNISQEWILEVRKLLYPLTVVANPCPRDDGECLGCDECHRIVVIDDEELWWQDDCVPLIIQFIDDHFFGEDELLSSMSISVDSLEDDDDDDDGTIVTTYPFPPIDSFQNRDLYFFDDQTGQWVPYTGPETVFTYAKLVVIPLGQQRRTHMLPKEFTTHFDMAKWEDDSDTIYCYVDADLIRKRLQRQSHHDHQLEDLKELVATAQSRIEFLKWQFENKPAHTLPTYLKHHMDQPMGTLPTQNGSIVFQYTVTRRE